MIAGAKAVSDNYLEVRAGQTSVFTPHEFLISNRIQEFIFAQKLLE